MVIKNATVRGVLYVVLAVVMAVALVLDVIDGVELNNMADKVILALGIAANIMARLNLKT